MYVNCENNIEQYDMGFRLLRKRTYVGNLKVSRTKIKMM